MKKITGFMLALCAAWNAAFALAGEIPPCRRSILLC